MQLAVREDATEKHRSASRAMVSPPRCAPGFEGQGSIAHLYACVH